jgi:hypothetical protein
MLLPDPATQIGGYGVLSSKVYEELTFPIDPQERADRNPVLEFPSSEEPHGGSLRLGLACNVIICVRVWGRKPFVYALFYLGPWVEN